MIWIFDLTLGSEHRSQIVPSEFFFSYGLPLCENVFCQGERVLDIGGYDVPGEIVVCPVAIRLELLKGHFHLQFFWSARTMGASRIFWWSNIGPSRGRWSTKGHCETKSSPSM